MPVVSARRAVVSFALCLACVGAHTWLFSRGRAFMEASRDKPFRQRKALGQAVHAQVIVCHGVSCKTCHMTAYTLHGDDKHFNICMNIYVILRV